MKWFLLLLIVLSVNGDVSGPFKNFLERIFTSESLQHYNIEYEIVKKETSKAKGFAVIDLISIPHQQSPTLSITVRQSV